ncbi:TadF, partial [Pasteurella multocida subsp. multocida str. Anand1_goat]
MGRIHRKFTHYFELYMKESGLVKFKHFWKNKKGAVTIEFLFMSMFLIVLFAFLFDLVMLRS